AVLADQGRCRTMRDPYETLGLPKDADADAIKRAYRRLAKQLHPDLNPGDVKIETRFKEVSAAHDLLSDPKKRARYDRGEIDAEVPVTLHEAAMGATITVPTIEGKVAVKVPPGSNSGTVLRLKGRGIPGKNGGAAGDQYATLTVVLPPRLDADLQHFLEKWG